MPTPPSDPPPRLSARARVHAALLAELSAIPGRMADSSRRLEAVRAQVPR